MLSQFIVTRAKAVQDQQFAHYYCTWDSSTMLMIAYASMVIRDLLVAKVFLSHVSYAIFIILRHSTERKLNHLL